MDIHRLFWTTIMTATLSTALSASDFQTDRFVTATGKDVVFTAIKHGSLRISCGNTEIEVDPVSGMEPETDYTAFPKADIILVTHEHSDHFDAEAISALSKPETKLFANTAVQSALGYGTALTNGASASVSPDIGIEAVPAYNTTDGRSKFHPKGRDNGYILSLHGLRIYIAGDTENIREMADLRDIDIAFLPCNQPYTMTPEQVAVAAKTIRPKVLFPYHYSDTKVGKVAELLAESGIDVRIRNYR